MLPHPNSDPGTELRRFRFYRVPKALLDSGLSLEAATLYGLMLERVELSARNGWTDGRVFIYFTQKDVQKLLRCGHNRATAFMRELERFGLIERRRQGQGKPAKIYVNSLPGGEPPEDGAGGAAKPARKREEGALFLASDQAVRTARPGPSGPPPEGRPERPKRAAKETEKSKPESRETHPILPRPPARSQEERMEEMRWVREEIREHIDYEGLIWDYPGDSELFDGYVELMVEAACSPRETVRVCGQDLPAAAVRGRFLKLNREHILYVRDCLCGTAAAIGNIKAYTLAALYNAPSTMGQYYAALAARDLAREQGPSQG